MKPTKYTIDDKSQLKSWLLNILSQLEVSDLDNAAKTESSDTTTLVIKWKN